MKVLVPLPFDLSTLAHGRNLRVVHLLRELNRQCELLVLVPNAARAEMARQVLPGVPVESPSSCLTHFDTDDLLPGELAGTLHGWVRRAVAFFGFDPGLVRETVKRAAESDVVFGFDLPSAVYLLAARHVSSEYRPRIVCDVIDDPWLTWRSGPVGKWFSPAQIKLAVAVRQMRRAVLSAFDACIAVAPHDAQTLSLATGLNVTVVPNGVSLPDVECLCATREPWVVFTGAMQFPPNEQAACWLARRVWPRVLKAFGVPAHSGTRCEHSPVRLAIVGTQPSAQVRQLAGLPGITVTGQVPDVSAWLRRAQVAVAPMRSGCGIKNKVLEACAAACPVIATSLGAGGLPTGEAHGVLIADRPAAFADAIVALLKEPAHARRLGAAGRAMVAQRYTWPRVTQSLQAVLAGTSASRPCHSEGVRASGITCRCTTARAEVRLRRDSTRRTRGSSIVLLDALSNPEVSGLPTVPGIESRQSCEKEAQIHAVS